MSNKLIHILVFPTNPEGGLGTLDAMQSYYASDAPAVGDEIEVEIPDRGRHHFVVKKRRWHSFKSSTSYDDHTTCRVFVNHS